MDLRPFPTHDGARHDVVAIDHLLSLTHSRLFRITGNPDVIATRLGLRQLQKLGLKALVFGQPAEVMAPDAMSCANDEALPAD